MATYTASNLKAVKCRLVNYLGFLVVAEISNDDPFIIVAARDYSMANSPVILYPTVTAPGQYSQYEYNWKQLTGGCYIAPQALCIDCNLTLANNIIRAANTAHIFSPFELFGVPHGTLPVGTEIELLIQEFDII